MRFVPLAQALGLSPDGDRLAFYWHDAGLHKKAVDEMMISTLEDYVLAGSGNGARCKGCLVSTKRAGARRQEPGPVS
jgi:hypothetical protein